MIVAKAPLGVGGDFDLSGALDVQDLNALNGAINAGGNDPRFNLTNDEIVDELDMDAWLTQLKGTRRGDANLDGDVNFVDFLALSDGFGKPGDWSQGDFDGSGEVLFPDFLILSENFGEAAGVAPFLSHIRCCKCCSDLVVAAFFVLGDWADCDCICKG